MEEQLCNLVDALCSLPRRPADIQAFLRRAPAAGQLPPPQLTWTLLSLVRYRARKLWAWDALSTRLGLDLPLGCNSPLTEKRMRGVLPGLPEWEFDLDSNDSYLIHRVTGEQIHLDLLNGPELINDGAFVHFVTDQRNEGVAEARLRQLHPGGHGLDFCVALLRQAGILGQNDYEIELDGDPFDFIAEILDPLCRLWDRPQDRIWLGAWIGDWPAADEAARVVRGPQLIALTEPRAQATCQAWWATIEEKIRSYGLFEDALLASAASKHSLLPQYLAEALTTSDLSYAALDIIKDDASWLGQVSELFIRRQTQQPYAGVQAKCAEYLVRHGFQPYETISALMGRHPSCHRPAIMLAIEHVPQMIREVLPRALRSSHPDARLTAAAILAIWDDDWSHDQLESVLEASDDPSLTLECRVASRESRFPQVRFTADLWESRHPSFDLRSTPLLGWYDSAASCRTVFHEEMFRVGDRVLAIRHDANRR